MKNILIPVDFSLHAQSAMEAAVAIAKKTNGKLHLLNIISSMPLGWQNLPVEEQQMHPELEARLVEAQLKLQKFSEHPALVNCKVHTHIEGGIPFEEINQFAKKIKADLIVMGIHGAEEKNLKFVGSTAQRVIPSASCPVLSIKKDFRFTSLNKILFASDFDEHVGPAINTTLELASQLNADIEFAYVHLPGDSVNKVMLESRIRKSTTLNADFNLHIVIHDSVEKDAGIIDCADKLGANIIAMVTHFRKNKPSYLLGITDSVLYHSKVPVLSFVLDENRHQVEPTHLTEAYHK